MTIASVIYQRATQLLLCLTLGTTACSSLSDEEAAGCEAPEDEQWRHRAEMLPGRACLSCHDELSAAGTVYDRADAACNSGGVANVRVDILNLDGEIAITLTTNAAGNFYTRAPLPSPYKVRITSPTGDVATMNSAQTEGSCAHCHRKPGAHGADGLIHLVANGP